MPALGGKLVESRRVFAAPVVLSGEPTFATYGEPEDTAAWLSLAAADPSGAAGPFAVAQQLLGGEAAWHLQPYLAVLGALLSLSIWQIAAALDFDHAIGGSKFNAPLNAPRRALLAFLATAPVIVFGYAGWGGVRELAAATLLALAVALVLLLRLRAPLALAALALLAVLIPWGGAPGPAIPLAALAPYERLGELGEIDQRFAGQGPAILFEESPYADYFLGDLELAERRPADPDRVDYRELLGYPLLIVPRFSPHSRPPLPYRRRWQGEDYEVWQLPPTATFHLLFHMSIGAPAAAAALPDCSQTVGLGLLALANQLGAAWQDITLIAAAPRRGNRLGPTVAVAPGEARDLCGRRWDWIEAIGAAG